jgi:hypothetical protein
MTALVSVLGPERHLLQRKRMSAFREQSGSRRRALEATLLTHQRHGTRHFAVVRARLSHRPKRQEKL